MNKDKPIDEQREFDFYFWDFDADGDGKVADFYVRNTKLVKCDEFKMHTVSGATAIGALTGRF